MDKIINVSHHNNLTDSHFNANGKELDLFITLIYKYKFIEDKKTIIKYDDIKKYINLSERSYETFEKLLHNLQDTTIYLKHLDGKYDRIKPFPTLTFDKDNKEIRAEINSNLLEMVGQIKNNFTKYSLQEFINLKYSHSKRIYQFIKRWVSFRERKISLLELKKYLDCNTDGYLLYKDFNRTILKKAVDEINKKTNLVVKYETIKYKLDGEKRASVKEILFKFYEKQKDILEVEEISENIEKAVIKVKRNIFVSKSWNKRVDSKIENLILKYGEKYTIEILNDLYKSIKKDVNTTLVQYINGIIKNKKIEKEDKKQVKSKEFQGIKPKEEKRKVLKTEMREPKKEVELKEQNINDYTEKEIEKAVKKCSEYEEVTEKFLFDLKKKSERVFMVTIGKYLENISSIEKEIEKNMKLLEEKGIVKLKFLKELRETINNDDKFLKLLTEY